MSLAVGPASGDTPVQPVNEFTSATVTSNLATGPQVTFGMNATSDAAVATSGLATDLWVYRNGIAWRRCRVLPVDQVWGDSGENDASVTAVGYQRLIEARFVVSGPPRFVGVDQGTIVWNLVQHTQSQPGGNLGVTAGSVLTGQVRDRNEYAIGDSIGTLLNNLGDVINGVWWGVDVNKVLSCRLLAGFPTRPDPIVLGMNARRLTRQRGKTFANAVGSVGSKTVTAPVWVTAPDVGTDPRGRWEAFDSTHGSVTDQQTVADYANGLLADRTYPPSIWTVDLDAAAYFEGGSDYAEGEFVRIVVPPSAVDEIGGPPVDRVVQVTEVSVAFDDSGAVTVTVAAVEVS